MKYLLLLAAIAATLIGCSTPEKKVHKCVMDYIKKTADNPRSYKPDDFGEIDTVYTATGKIEELKIVHSFRVNNAFGNPVHHMHLYTVLPLMSGGFAVIKDLDYNSPEYKRFQNWLYNLSDQ